MNVKCNRDTDAKSPNAGTVLYLDFRRGERIQEQKLAGVRRYADGCGWRLVVCSERRSRRSNLPLLLKRHRPVGCIVEGSTEHGPVSRSVLNGLPTVYLDNRHVGAGRGAGAVFVDGRAVAETAFAELRANRPSAYGVVGYRVCRKWAEDRTRAFSAAVLSSGAKLLRFGPNADEPAVRAKRLARWVAALPKNAAVFAVNDETALEVVAAARTSGRVIPRDFTLLGVDNMERECETSEPKLSSVQLDFERAGYKAAEMLKKMVCGDAAGAGHIIVMPLTTVRREGGVVATVRTSDRHLTVKENGRTVVDGTDYFLDMPYGALLVHSLKGCDRSFELPERLKGVPSFSGVRHPARENVVLKNEAGKLRIRLAAGESLVLK